MSMRMWIVALLFAASSVRAGAQCEGGRIGHWGGTARAVTSIGNTIFAAIGSDLVVLDAFNPGRPYEIARIPLPGPSWRMAADDELGLVLAIAGGRPIVIDVSNRANPRVVSEIEGVGGGAFSVQGGFAYVGGSSSQFWVVDLEIPSSPRIAGGLSLGETVSDIAARDGFVYASVGSETLVIDATNPNAPAIAGSLPFEFAAVDIFEDRLALASDGEVRLYDISQGPQPRLLGTTGVPGVGLFSDIALAAGYVYVTDGNSTISTVDINDPAHPTYIHIALADAGWGIARLNDFAVAAGGGRGVQVYGPRSGFIGRFGHASRGADFAVSGDIVYFAAGTAGLQVIDISDPHAPRSLAEVLPALPHDETGDVALAGSRLFVANSISGVRIYDVTNPTRPQPIGHLDGRTSRLAIENDRLWVLFSDVDSDGSRAMDVYDQLDSEPRLINRMVYPVGRRPRDLVAAGNRLAVGHESGVTVYDVADPASPVILLDRQSGNPTTGVALDGEGRVFSITYNGHGQVFEIGRPYSVGSFRTAWRERISISDRRLYASGFRSPTSFEIGSEYFLEQIRDYPIAAGGGGDTSYAQRENGLLVVASSIEGLVLFQAGGAGDIDRDGVVGLSDLAVVLGHYGQSVSHGQRDGDVNCDGQVSLEDLLLLLREWGV